MHGVNFFSLFWQYLRLFTWGARFCAEFVACGAFVADWTYAHEAFFRQGFLTNAVVLAWVFRTSFAGGYSFFLGRVAHDVEVRASDFETADAS